MALRGEAAEDLASDRKTGGPPCSSKRVLYQERDRPSGHLLDLNDSHFHHFQPSSWLAFRVWISTFAPRVSDPRLRSQTA